MPEQKPEMQSKEKPGLFNSMSGIQKALLLIFALAIFFLIWTFVFGGIATFYQLIFFVISFFAISALFYGIMIAVSWYMQPEFFSPKKDYFTRVVNLAIDLKPSNVKDLYFMGDKDKRRVKAGSIIGLLGIPYLVGRAKFHENDVNDKEGKLIAKKGEPIFRQSIVLKRKIPVFEKIEYGKDGDTLIVYEAGWFFFKRRHYLRCHRKLHGDLNGDVVVYDINPVPYGVLYEYPFKQLQQQPERIMIQNQLEVILATSEHHLDLISQGVDSAVYFNPYFRLVQQQKAEMVSGQ